jgi:hypothetical protein
MNPHPCDLRPATDPHTRQLLDHAVRELARLRNLSAHDPAARLHLIGSLLEQGEHTLSNAVIDAIDVGHTDLEIRILLGLG